MTNKQLDEKFRLADNCIPPLYEGDYSVKMDQIMTVSKYEQKKLSIEKKFYVAINTETLANSDIFHVSPAPNEQGVFSTELPFIVLNNPSYPWIKNISPIDGFPVPWVALIVLSKDEVEDEKDIKHSALANEVTEANKNGIFFKYDNKNSPCRDDDLIHIVKISKAIFDNIMPSKEDRVWLTHCKNQVDLSRTDEDTIQKDGNFSVVIANRFPPLSNAKKIKYTAHLIPAYLYDNENISCKSVELISLYHWSFFSEKIAVNPDNPTSDKSFYSFIKRFEAEGHSRQVQDSTLKEHFLRTGERTYSLYHGPIMPMKYIRANNINGEKIFTSDGRLIYDKKNGIFDVSYAAAFNLGKLVTLSHKAEAQKIVNWRKKQKFNEHLKLLKKEIGINHIELKKVLEKLKEGQLK